MSMEFMKRGMKRSEAYVKAQEDEDDRRLLAAAGWALDDDDERPTRALTEEEKKEKVWRSSISTLCPLYTNLVFSPCDSQSFFS